MKNGRVSEIDGVRIIKSNLISDARGSFIKFYPLKELVDPLDSVALSMNPKVGTVRGLHFQVEPFAEEKLVTCIQGAVFDIILDLRMNSNTFGKWMSIELNTDNALQVYLPKGVAHGFQTLSPNSIVHYSLTSSFSPESSFAINPLGDIDIGWPLDVASISERDSDGISFQNAAQKYADSIHR